MSWPDGGAEERPVEPGAGAAGAGGADPLGDGDGRGDAGGFRQIGERARFQGTFLEIVTGTFVGPDGFTFERDLVRHPGAVCVVALEADRRHVLVVRQYRAPVDRTVLELPAGKKDVPGEADELCARRELAEEVGREATTWTELSSFYNSPGFTDEQTVCFLAENLTPCARELHGVEERHMTVERLDLADVPRLVAAGEIVDGKTIVGLMLARDLLGFVASGNDARAFDAAADDVAADSAPDNSAPDEVGAEEAAAGVVGADPDGQG
jgi:ADP-ribose pyrophosphatase